MDPGALKTIMYRVKDEVAHRSHRASRDIAIVVLGRNPVKLAQGELRCQGGGAIIINIDGKDYAVNGMASPGYPPIQDIWNKATFPETDIDRLIARGLTLCDW